MRNIETKKKKILNKILKYKDNTDKLSIYIIDEFGAWFDITTIENILMHNKLNVLIKYQKIITNISNKVYKEVEKQFANKIIEISKIKNLDKILDNILQNITNSEIKELCNIVFITNKANNNKQTVINSNKQ